MDIKYISIEKILILYGGIGTIIFFVYSLITTLILIHYSKCEKEDCIPNFGEIKYLENIGSFFVFLGKH